LGATNALAANPGAAAAALGSFIPGMTKGVPGMKIGGKSKKRTHKFTSKKIRFKLPRKSKKTRR
jgi:hypothetical protein